MLVKDYMIKHPPMVSPKTSIVEAQQVMSENQINHLPVVKDGKRLIGLVTRQSMLLNPGRLSSLDVWDIATYLGNLKVKDVMIKRVDVVTIEPDTPIEQAALIMVQREIGCLPVLDGEVVMGLITERDLLVQMAEMMAGRMAGVRVTVRMPMVQGELAKLVTAIASRGLSIVTMGGAIVPKDETRWDAVVKIAGERGVVLDAIQTVEDHEIIDVREA